MLYRSHFEMSGTWSVLPDNSRTRMDKTKWPRHTSGCGQRSRSVSRPVASIEGSVVDRFAEMLGRYLFAPGEIGDCSANTQDLVMSAG
jgi:hypothetical protein